jgi:hypothetical protein
MFKHLNYDEEVDTRDFLQVDVDGVEYPLYLPEDRDIILNGHYQSRKYFEGYDDYIRNILKISDDRVSDYVYTLRQKFPGKFLVAVHVRRGWDYVELNWTVPLEYYKDSAKILTRHHKDIQYIVFTNDLSWCRENLPDDWYITRPREDYIELLVMSELDGIIMSNSTFSLWATFLNTKLKENSVTIPYPWFRSTRYNMDIYEPEWIKVDYI